MDLRYISESTAIFSCLYGLVRSRRRRWWVRPMLYKRNEAGNRLLADIAEEAADETIIQFLRMTEEDFEYMLQKITPKICKQDTYMRKAITVRERLIIGLRFIATGENFKSLQFLFRVS